MVCRNNDVTMESLRLIVPFSKKRTVKLHQHLYSFIKVCVSMLKQVFLGFCICVLHSNAYKNMCEIFLMLFCSVFMKKDVKTWFFRDYRKEVFS